MKTLHFTIFLLIYNCSLFAQSTQEQEWNNQSCGTLSFFEDSLLLHLPKDAFYKNDKLILGNVNIKVELYSNYFDMLRGHIPMKDESGLYVSGGMYQLFITKKGEEVTFGKEIQVSYISDGNDKFNAYVLDQSSSQWNTLPTPVLDYARGNSSSNSKDWGALSPQEANPDMIEDVWGSSISSEWMYKTMNISGNGLYNYDYLIGKKELITYAVKIDNTDINELYVHYPCLNTVIYYSVDKEGYVLDFSLLNTDLSKVRIFTLTPSKDKKKCRVGELSKASILALSTKKENQINFIYSEVNFTKNALDNNLSSL